MKKILKLSYTSMWPNFNPDIMPQDYFFEFVLSQKYHVVYDAQDPDVLIYSVFGPPPDKTQLSSKTLLVAYSGEPYDPEGFADITFGFHFHNRVNYFRLPIWALWIHWDNLDWPYKLAQVANAGQGSHHVATTNNHVNDELHPMRMSNMLTKHTKPHLAEKFCNFTYTRNAKERVEFFLMLNQKKKVDSTGKLFNNSGYYLASKPHDLHQWKFTLAFENTQMPGYVTEKLIEPLAAASIPIYWGGNHAAIDFNSKSFINVNEFDSFAKAIDWIMHVENTPDLQQQYLQEPIFSSIPQWPNQVFAAIYEKLIEKNPSMEIT